MCGASGLRSLSLLAILAVFETSRATLTGFRVIIGNRQAVKPMDEPFESFLTEGLALEGEDENAIREGVRVALADYEQVFRAQEVNIWRSS